MASTGCPTSSPFGDAERWDLLWPGHCGCRFPADYDRNVPNRTYDVDADYSTCNDPTVPTTLTRNSAVLN